MIIVFCLLIKYRLVDSSLWWADGGMSWASESVRWWTPRPWGESVHKKTAASSSWSHRSAVDVDVVEARAEVW